MDQVRSQAVGDQAGAREASEAFGALWRTRDLAPWIDALAEDVRLISPLFRATFEGRDEAAELYAAVLASLRNVEILDELHAGSTCVVHWSADAGSRRIEGVDFLGVNAVGKIAEVRVMIRPLVSLAAFSAAVGPRLARQRGPLRFLLTRVLIAPMQAIFLALDRLAPRLVKQAHAAGRG